MRAGVLLGILFGSGVALGQGTPPPASGRYETALKHARAGRAAFEQRVAPKYQGGGSLESEKQFIAKEIGGWLHAARRLHDEAQSRYTKALEAASSSAERVTVLSEVGEMSLRLAERTYRAGEASMPKNIARDADIRAAYLSALDDAAAPMREAAAATLQRCVTLAETERVKSSAAKRCVALRDNPAALDPKLSASPAEVERGVRQVRAKIRQCYERALEGEAGLGGDLVVQMTVGPAGTLGPLKLSGSLAGHPLAACVRGVIQGIRLPAPAKGSKVTLSYPLKFAPGS